MERKINYSIIIPHKNIPDLLRRCLDSIPRRDDVQIIVVDDNSDPAIVDFEHFPGLNDPFIEVVFTKEGKGGGYARNVGLTKAVGKWLLFADADDFYNYCVNDILDEYADSQADIICFKHNSVDCNNYTAAIRCAGFIKRINYWLRNPTNKKADYLLRYRHIAEWGKFFKAGLIKNNNILFDEISIAIGVTFIYLAGFYAASIRADPRALYCTTIRTNSIRNKKKNEQKRIDEIYVNCKRYLFFKRNGIPFHDGVPFIIFMFKCFFIDKKKYNKIKNILKDLGFTSKDFFKLCAHDIFIITPNKTFEKIDYFFKRIFSKAVFG